MEDKRIVLCFGDSNTYGFNPKNGRRYPEHVRWTGILQEILGASYRVIEEGCNGRTTVFEDPEEGWKSGLPYLKPCLNTHKPVDWFVVMLGSNDMKKQFHASPEDVAEGMEKIIETVISFTGLKQGFVPEILLIAPPYIGRDVGKLVFRHSFDESAAPRSEMLGALYEKIAERYGCRFLNAAEKISASPVDALHLEPEAHETLAEEIAQIIKRREGCQQLLP